MRSSAPTPADFEVVREFARQRGKLVARCFYRKQGPGLDVNFPQMEDLAWSVAQGLLQGTWESCLAARKSAKSAPPCCPRMTAWQYISPSAPAHPFRRAA